MPTVIPSPPRRSNAHFIHRISLIEGDLLAQTDVDAIASAITPDLHMGGALNRALIAAAGRQIDDFILENIFRPRPGDVFAVPPFALPVKHIFYAVIPVWRDGIAGEERDLTRCYRGLIHLARQMKLKSLALPALGTGQGRFPPKRAARLGVQGILDRIGPGLEDIRIVCADRETYNIFVNVLAAQGWAGH